NGLRAVSRTGTTLRGDRPGAGAAGRHGQDVAAPGSAGSAGAIAASRHGARGRLWGRLPACLDPRDRLGGCPTKEPARGQRTMNCHDCQRALQASLDGEPGPSSAALADHLVTCATCQRLHDASQRLRRGLCLLAPSSVPAGLLDRVVAAVRIDRRQRQRQRFRLAGALALAASVLVIVLAGQMLPGPTPPRDTGFASVRPASFEKPSIRDTVAEAGSAVADLTKKTVDQAVDHTRVLLPSMDEVLLSPMELPSPLEPTSLTGAGQGVSAGLEPL